MGCADRSAYDLTQHTQATGVRLVAEKKLVEPKVEDVVAAVPNKGAIGKGFKKDAKVILEQLAALSASEVENLEKQLRKNGYIKNELIVENYFIKKMFCVYRAYVLTINAVNYSLGSDMVSVKRYQETRHVEEIIPSVIEPSFGKFLITTKQALPTFMFRNRQSDVCNL